MVSGLRKRTPGLGMRAGVCNRPKENGLDREHGDGLCRDGRTFSGCIGADYYGISDPATTVAIAMDLYLTHTPYDPCKGLSFTIKKRDNYRLWTVSLSWT